MKNAAPFVTILLVATVAGCRTGGAPDAAGPDAVVEGAADADVSAPGGAPGQGGTDAPTPVAGGGEVPRPGLSPAELYASCEDRVEQPEADGECTTDADCARAGCSQELCVAATAAADLMSTCEVQPCFDALDACGCVEGRCRWTLKEAVSSDRPKVVLPGRLPASGEGAPTAAPTEAASEGAAGTDS